MTTRIEARGLCQGYRDRAVISGLNLVWESGILGLLGPNGAGKTTLLRTLATITPPRSGTLRLLGRDLASVSDIRAVRRGLGYVPQHFGFYRSFSVYEFVRYCAWLREIPPSQSHEATLKAIERVGLTAQRDAKLRTLSGGMRRRCAIAQAIVGDVKLLLLDEPTVGLDPQQRLEFRKMLHALPDVSVVISTHLVEDVAALCDQVRVMVNGTFVFSGGVGELASLAKESESGGGSELERGYLAAVNGMRTV